MRQYTALFKALSDETRLRLLKMLLAADRPICVCELADAIGLPQYRVSKHLAVLRHVGLVEDDRTGTWVNYSVVRPTSPVVEGLFELIQTRINNSVTDRDLERLNARLAFRDGDRCVLGPEAPEVHEAFARSGLVPTHAEKECDPNARC